ncbi:MAG TPA: histidine phosphatase family protein [Mycobacteriales bacterium]|nr:histidine phosphatase family protein [Mycobacteriales bacterium]
MPSATPTPNAGERRVSHSDPRAAITADHVILWRHGRTGWNMQRRFQGQSDPPLDAVGLAQARAAAHHLAAVRPRAIVSSDLARAAQTAEALAALVGLPVRCDRRLRERSVGRWEGLTRDEVRQRYPREYAEWIAGDAGRRGGGELRSEVAERAAAGLAELTARMDLAAGVAPDGPVVLVTHSATGLALIGYLLGLPEPHWRTIAPLANCHWSELRHDDGGWRLRSHNVGAVTPPAPPVPADVAEAEEAPEPADAEALDGPSTVGPAATATP